MTRIRHQDRVGCYLYHGEYGLQRALVAALREYEAFCNGHRPHQGIANARPLAPLPGPITDPERLTRLYIGRRDHLGGILQANEHAA